MKFRRAFLLSVLLAVALVGMAQALPRADHAGDDDDHKGHDHAHDHEDDHHNEDDHHHHHHDDDENKVEGDGKADKEDGNNNKTGHAHDDHDHASHHNVHHMSHSLDNLWARWDALESAMCGPKPGQAHALVHRYKMRPGEDGASWQTSDYFTSELTTRSEELGTSERAIYSGGHKLLEGDAILPWVRMTKSATLVLWHKGSNMLLHTISANGTHDEVVLGDELADNHAKFMARVPANVWLALEIDGHDDSSYAFFSTVLVPGWKQEYMEWGTEDLAQLVGEEHAAMAKRLVKGAKKPGHDHHSHGGGGGDDDDHHHGHHDHAASHSH